MILNHQTPKKPDKQKDQISMLWDAVYNHIFHRLNFIDLEIKFILVFLALILTFLGIAIFSE